MIDLEWIYSTPETICRKIFIHIASSISKWVLEASVAELKYSWFRLFIQWRRVKSHKRICMYNTIKLSPLLFVLLRIRLFSSVAAAAATVAAVPTVFPFLFLFSFSLFTGFGDDLLFLFFFKMHMNLIDYIYYEILWSLSLTSKSIGIYAYYSDNY